MKPYSESSSLIYRYVLIICAGKSTKIYDNEPYTDRTSSSFSSQLMYTWRSPIYVRRCLAGNRTSI